MSVASRSSALRLLDRRLLATPGWVVLIELFIGLGWLRAATEKLIDPSWLSGTPIDAFIIDHADLTIGWYQPVIDSVVLPNLTLVGLAVVATQVAAGVALVTGRRVGWALIAGMFLNLNFVLVGAVDPSIFYLVAQMALGMWILEQGTSAAVARRTVTVVNLAAVSGTQVSA
jgi:hypothetical protein